MKKYYLLSVLDVEDDFCYETLIYDNLEDYEKAIEVIEKVDKYWYSNEFEENEETIDGYYEYLILKLKQQNIYNPIIPYKIYVR